MSTHNICFCGEIRKYQYFWTEKSALTSVMPVLCYCKLVLTGACCTESLLSQEISLYLTLVLLNKLRCHAHF